LVRAPDRHVAGFALKELRARRVPKLKANQVCVSG
jgi:hypothetical protein